LRQSYKIKYRKTYIYELRDAVTIISLGNRVLVFTKTTISF